MIGYDDQLANTFSPSDSGPIYQETLIAHDHFFAEPWNAISSLAIVLPAIYWAIKLKKHQVRDFLFMWYCIPLLILGGTGSTLYHGFRNSEWLLLLDVLPTALMTLSIGILFWVRYLKNWYITIGLFVLSFIFRYFIYQVASDHTATNIAYFVTGTLIFLPILLYLKRNNWLGLKWILLSVLFLVLSLVFREIDRRGIFGLEMGTHFLWHLLSGVGAYYLARFLYILRLFELNTNKLA
ncbi:MAG: ceramidase domain-containing protein [Bacteroidota bacterium]